MELAGKEVVVVGCSSGIGRALAAELAGAGARLTLFGRNAAGMQALASEIQAAGGQAAVEPGDTRDAARVAEVCAGFDDARPLYGVVFAAGVSHATSVRAFRADEAREVMETNAFGFFSWFEHAAPLLRAQRAGFFLGVSALCAYRGIPSGAVYAASKGALSNFLEGVRLDLEPEGVKVFEVMPGFVDTPMTELNTHISMPGMISAERAARAIVRAVRRDRYKVELPWLHELAFFVARLLPVWLYRLASRGYVFGRYHLEHALEALPPLSCAEHGPLVFNRYGSWRCLGCERAVHAVRDRFNVIDVAPEAADPGAPGSIWGGLCKVRARARAFYAQQLRAGRDPLLVIGGGDGRLLRGALRDAEVSPERALCSVEPSRRGSLRAAKRLARWPRTLHLIGEDAALEFEPGGFRHVLCLGLSDPALLARAARALAPEGELALHVWLEPRAPRTLPPRTLCLADVAAVEGLLAEAGLRAAELQQQGSLVTVRATRVRQVEEAA